MTKPELKPIKRPNGRVYYPRKIVTDVWQDDDSGWGDGTCGAIVLGTHDVEAARPLADSMIKSSFDTYMAAVEPKLGWYRSAIRYGRSQWVSDPDLGRAAVWFTAREVDESG